MSSPCGIPNFLPANSFKLEIRKAPILSATAKSITLPDISSNPAIMPTPFKNIALTSDKPEYGNLVVEFNITENLENYIEIVNWIKGVTFPDSFDQYSTAEKEQFGDGLYSDASVIILTNKGNPNFDIQLKNIVPISCSSITLFNENGEQYIVAEATFTVQNFEIVKL